MFALCVLWSTVIWFGVQDLFLSIYQKFDGGLQIDDEEGPQSEVIGWCCFGLSFLAGGA